jgi:hypothetical protein
MTDLSQQQTERAAALDHVLHNFRDQDDLPVLELIPMADGVQSGTADLALGIQRVKAEIYESRWGQ